MSSSSSNSPPNPSAAAAPPDSRILEPWDDADRDAERGFSLFMKAGGCTDPFLRLGKCFFDASRIKEDALERCRKAASDLNKCVASNLGYYRPVFSVSDTTAVPEEEALGEMLKPAVSDPNPSAASHESESPKQGEERGEDDEEEEGECGFCLFMKGGGCRDTFTDWEKCIEEAEKSGEDIVDKCFQATAALKTCMEAHSDYYEPILRAEKAAEEEAVRELEKEANELKDAATAEGK